MSTISKTRRLTSLSLAFTMTVAMAALTSGCGGGGDDDSQAPPPVVGSPSPSPSPGPAPTPSPSPGEPSPTPAPAPSPAPSPAPTPSPTPAPVPTPTPPSASGFTLDAVDTKAVVFQGGSATVAVKATRLGGFSGTIDLTLTGLPAGVSASAARIPAGSDTASVTLNAAASAPHSLPTPVSIDGAADAVAAKATVTVTVRGVAGMVDTSFGNGGHAITGVGPSDDYAKAMAIQPDGKVVVAGWGYGANSNVMQLVRWQRDGGLDTSFGTGGRVLLDLGARAAQANAVALQADGKLLVAGSVDPTGQGKQVALVRLNANGAIDGSFGQGGKVITSLGSTSDEAFAIVVQGDGKIVLGGHTSRGNTSGLDFALLRFDANGALDPSFGQGGVVVDAMRAGTARDSIYALAQQVVNGETMIVAAGGEGDFVVQRYRADGSRDASFGGGSSRIGIFGSTVGAARGVAITGDNTIVLVGHVNEDMATMRLLANGAFDPTFSQDGRVITRVSAGNWDEAQAVAVQADGKIVVGGWAYSGNSSSGDHVVLRYNVDGSLDAGFGNGGITVTAVAGTRIDEGRALMLQADERVPAVRSVVAGVAANGDRDFAVTRYWH